jgi:hypothetical protein
MKAGVEINTAGQVLNSIRFAADLIGLHTVHSWQCHTKKCPQSLMNQWFILR